jgi:hypothetical protein
VLQAKQPENALRGSFVEGDPDAHKMVPAEKFKLILDKELAQALRALPVTTKKYEPYVL